MNRFQKWEYYLGVYNDTMPLQQQKDRRLSQYENLSINTKKTEDDRTEIMKDINRTYQEFEIFQQENNKNIMCNVLLVWCNNSLSYRQGMNEIIGVLFYTYHQQNCEILDENVTKIESDLYWTFKAIMDDGNHKENYNYSSTTPIDKTPLIRYIKTITQVKLKHIDEQLFSIFEQNAINGLKYSLCLFMCLLAREYEIDQVQWIWDKIFEKFKTSKLKFLDAMIITMMVQLKQQLLKIEYINNFEVLLLFQNYPAKENYQQMLKQAETIHMQLQEIEKPPLSEILKRINPAYSLKIILQMLYTKQ